MDIKRLYEILDVCTKQFRKQEPIKITEKGNMTTTEIFDMPHVDDAEKSLVKVDLHFITIGVDKEIAEGFKSELVSILEEYPQPDRLKGGPSYIEVGAIIGDQGRAFQLFALGEVLELWKVITPETLHIPEPGASELAGRGMIMISGYQTIGTTNERKRLEEKR